MAIDDIYQFGPVPDSLAMEIFSHTQPFQFEMKLGSWDEIVTYNKFLFGHTKGGTRKILDREEEMKEKLHTLEKVFAQIGYKTTIDVKEARENKSRTERLHGYEQWVEASRFAVMMIDPKEFTTAQRKWFSSGSLVAGKIGNNPIVEETVRIITENNHPLEDGTSQAYLYIHELNVQYNQIGYPHQNVMFRDYGYSKLDSFEVMEGMFLAVVESLKQHFTDVRWVALYEKTSKGQKMSSFRLFLKGNPPVNENDLLKKWI